MQGQYPNAYDRALKTHLHISLDPITPAFHIRPPGITAIQCERISDCYAKELQDGATRITEGTGI